MSLVVYTVCVLIFAVCLSVGVSVGLARQVGRKQIDNVIELVVKQLADDVGLGTSSLLSLTERAVTMTAKRISDSEDAYQSKDQLRQALFDVMRVANFSLGQLYFGDLNDKFYSVDRNAQTAFFEYPSGGSNCSVAYVGITQDDIEDPTYQGCSMQGYKPTTRPWYKAISARTSPSNQYDQQWSDFYYFYDSMRQPSIGITLSQAVYTPSGLFVGVVGADFDLNELGQYIATKLPTASSRALLIDSTDTLIAASVSDTTPVQYKTSTGLWVRYTMSSWGDASANTLEKQYGPLAGTQKLWPMQIAGKYKGIPQYEFISTYPVRPDSKAFQWTAIMLIPEGDAVGVFDDPAAVAGGCAGIVIAVLVVTVGLVIALTYPVSRVTKDLECVANGTMSIQAFGETRLSIVTEISRIQKAVVWIATGTRVD